MPLIDIENFDSPIALQSAMYFPSDNDLRESYICQSLCEIETSNTSNATRISTDSGTLSRLINSPSKKEMTKLSNKALKDGYIAGFILMTVYLMDYFNLKEPSINKAIHILERYSLEERFGDGTAIPKEQAIKKIWKKMKPSVHLLAAKNLLDAYPLYEGKDVFRSKEHMIEFLRISATFLKFGTSFKPQRQNNMLMKMENSFQLPDEIMKKSLELELTLFPDGLLRLLDGYQAPKTSAYD